MLMNFSVSLRRMMLAVAAATAVFAPSSNAAMIVPTSFGTGADAYLQNDSQDAGTGPDVVRSTQDNMLFRYLVNSRVKIPYFRFDLSGIRGDRSGATLSLQVLTNNGNRSRALDVYGLIDDAVDEAWAEGTISYSNAPGFIYTDPDPVTAGNQPSNNFTIDPSEMVFLGTITTPAGLGVMTSTTAALNLNSFLAGDTNKLVTLALVRSVSDSNVQYTFATKENATAGVLFPTLTLPNALEIPEPVTAAMLVVGAFAFAIQRRRTRNNPANA
jgi:hypothetical protein